MRMQAVRSRGRRVHRPFGLGDGTKAPQVLMVSISFGKLVAEECVSPSPGEKGGLGRLLGLLLAKLSKLS